MLPVIMVTALDPAVERVKGIEAGADDFLTKPINQPELLARVKSLLRIKELHETVQAQARELSDWNQNLEQRVHEQVYRNDKLECPLFHLPFFHIMRRTCAHLSAR